MHTIFFFILIRSSSSIGCRVFTWCRLHNAGFRETPIWKRIQFSYRMLLCFYYHISLYTQVSCIHFFIPFIDVVKSQKERNCFTYKHLCQYLKHNLHVVLYHFIGFFYTKLPIFNWIGYYFILKINSVEMYTSY